MVFPDQIVGCVVLFQTPITICCWLFFLFLLALENSLGDYQIEGNRLTSQNQHSGKYGKPGQGWVRTKKYASTKEEEKNRRRAPLAA